MKELHSYFDEYNYTEALHQALKEMYAKYEVVEGPIAEDDPVRHWDPANPEHMVALVNPVQNSKSQNPHNHKAGTGPGDKKARRWSPDQSNRGKPALQKNDPTVLQPLTPNLAMPAYIPGFATWLPTMLHWASFKF